MRRQRELLLVIAFSVAILLSALPGRINIGVRHVLPVYIGLCVAGGVIAAQKRARSVAAFLVVCHVIAGAWGHPDYLAYTNALAFGHPERWVVDSDLDWGQDMNRLEQRLRRAGAQDFAFEPFNRTYSTLAGHILPRIRHLDSERPSPGWNAVSLTMWKLYGTPVWANNPPQPPEHVGESILLWYFPADSK
jgi:hypothetical protein